MVSEDGPSEHHEPSPSAWQRYCSLIDRHRDPLEGFLNRHLFKSIALVGVVGAPMMVLQEAELWAVPRWAAILALSPLLLMGVVQLVLMSTRYPRRCLGVILIVITLGIDPRFHLLGLTYGADRDSEYQDVDPDEVATAIWESIQWSAADLTVLVLLLSGVALFVWGLSSESKKNRRARKA